MKKKNDEASSLSLDLTFINLFKPVGYTSFDCIRKLRRILSFKKIGHLGTLDPLADGVLPIALGRATRLIEYLEKSRKKYRVTVQLGVTTDTDDAEGRIIRQDDSGYQPEISEIENTIREFTGEIDQVPPAYSAVHVKGKRAYELARKGEHVELSFRRVMIHKIEILRYDFPNLEIDVTCSAGTYIRSLARDMGKKLGIGGTVSQLRRLQSGDFDIKDSVTLDEISEAADAGNIASILIPPLNVLTCFPREIVNDESRNKIINGGMISENDLETGSDSMKYKNETIGIPENCSDREGIGRKIIILLDTSGEILATANRTNEGSITPIKVLFRSQKSEVRNQKSEIKLPTIHNLTSDF